MSLTVIGKKRGMTRIYCKKTGTATPCSVIELDSNVVVQIKNDEKDGYSAIQLGAFKLSDQEKKKATKPRIGHFAKAKVPACKKLLESRLDDTSSYEVGQEIGVDHFEEGKLVDVIAISKGKGYQGVIKRHNVARIVKSHGAGPIVRHLGSSGFMTSHGRVHKGKIGAGQMGRERKTIERLEVLGIDAEKKTLIVKGAIPGCNGSEVFVRKTLKENT